MPYIYIYIYIYIYVKFCLILYSVEKYGRAGQATDGNITRRMCFTCRITKAKRDTHTHSEYVILISFPLK